MPTPVTTLLTDFTLSGITDVVSDVPFNWTEDSFMPEKPSKNKEIRENIVPKGTQTAVSVSKMPQKAVILEKKTKKTPSAPSPALNPEASLWTIGKPNAPLTLLTAAMPERVNNTPFTEEEETLLGNILRAIGHTLEDCNMACVVAITPVGAPLTNKNIKALHPLAQKKLAGLSPKKIIALGQVAAAVFETGEATPLAMLRQKNASTATRANTPFCVTYHPKVLLKTPLLKKRTWQDLQLFGT